MGYLLDNLQTGNIKNRPKRNVVFFCNPKNQNDHVEVFDGLKSLCVPYPSYELAEIGDAFAFGKTVFENDKVQLVEKAMPGIRLDMHSYINITWLVNETVQFVAKLILRYSLLLF
ncbi:hypothetical protein DBR40_24925 [Pedobacter sp. KBW01]|nr:hypothetical protein DBR40_24925 [Pedobacter sp. KBW01]